MKRVGKTIPFCRFRRLRRTTPGGYCELALTDWQVWSMIPMMQAQRTHRRDGGLSGRDSAGHAFRGETRRNASLSFGRTRLVYFTYGSSFMLNVTSEAAGVGRESSCVPSNHSRESIGCNASAAAGLLDLARGPAGSPGMQIDFSQMVWICAPSVRSGSRRAAESGAIVKSVRIGLTRNVDRKLRFYEQGNP